MRKVIILIIFLSQFLFMLNYGNFNQSEKIPVAKIHIHSNIFTVVYSDFVSSVRNIINFPWQLVVSLYDKDNKSESDKERHEDDVKIYFSNEFIRFGGIVKRVIGNIEWLMIGFPVNSEYSLVHRHCYIRFMAFLFIYHPFELMYYFLTPRSSIIEIVYTGLNGTPDWIPGRFFIRRYNQGFFVFRGTILK